MKHAVQVERSAPLREQVVTRLEQMIVDGELRPGERLVESELASLLGVSRNPIREALPVLARSGWVVGPSRQGTFVQAQDLTEAKDTFHVREMLEVEAARLAAVNASPTVITELREMLTWGQELLPSGDRQDLVIANSTFHARIAKASGNRPLAELIETIDKRVRWYFATVAVERGPLSWAGHATLVQAIENRDPEAAEAAMQQHVGDTSKSFESSWNARQQRAQESARS